MESGDNIEKLLASLEQTSEVKRSEEKVIAYINGEFSVNISILNQVIESGVSPADFSAEVKRILHNIKGTSQFLGLHDLGSFVDRLEDFLGQVDFSGELNEQLRMQISLIEKIFILWKDNLSKNYLFKPNIDNIFSGFLNENISLDEFSATSDDYDSSNKLKLQVESRQVENIQQFLKEFDLILNEMEIDNFEASRLKLAKILRKMSGEVSYLRLQKLEPLFEELREEVVRLSLYLGKKVEIRKNSQGVTVDVAIIEQIKESLLHILRNSIDHGIESTEVRKKFGKDETGLIQINAATDGEEVTLEIIDDGGGINEKRIMEKAREKNIETKDLTSEQLKELIFVPGFSTATEVSEISGRGIGMDSVKKNIENLGGKIEIFSQIGEGAKFQIKLPMTKASLLDVLLLKTCETYYLVSASRVKETLDIANFQIELKHDSLDTIGYLSRGKEAVKVVSVKNILHQEIDRFKSGVMVLSSINDTTVGVVFEDIIGFFRVSVQKLASDYNGIYGTSFLRNGRIGYALNLGKIYNWDNSL